VKFKPLIRAERLQSVLFAAIGVWTFGPRASLAWVRSSMPSLKAFLFLLCILPLTACGDGLSENGKARERCVNATVQAAKARAEWEIAEASLSPAATEVASEAYWQAWNWKTAVCRGVDMNADPFGKN
jgi:hypothetical protein